VLSCVPYGADVICSVPAGSYPAEANPQYCFQDSNVGTWEPCGSSNSYTFLNYAIARVFYVVVDTTVPGYLSSVIGSTIYP
jgi:hypothetical protein